MRIRRNSLTVPANTKKGYTHFYKYAGNPVEHTDVYYVPEHVTTRDTVQDVNHARCYPRCGGPMAVRHKIYRYGQLSILNGYNYPSQDKYSWVTGGWIAPRDNFSLVPSVASSGILSSALDSADEPVDFDGLSSHLSSAGNTAYNRYRPKLEKINLLESLAELPSTVRSLSAEAFLKQKEAIRYGDSHVAVQFGFLPLVRDIKGFVNLVINTEQQIHRLVKGNGRWLRKTGTVNQEQLSGTTPLKLDTVYYQPRVGQCKKAVHEVKMSTKLTFTGMFRYYVPDIGKRSYAGRMEALRTLVGLRITPSNVYNCIPWSWLTDWCTNAGDWVNNYSSQTADDCACQYAFITERTVAESNLYIEMVGSFAYPSSSKAVSTTASGSSNVTYSSVIRSGSTNCFSFAGGPLNEKQALILHSIMRGRF